jgi:drug/metabolite transporter (DMT)-like permease
MSAQPTQTMRAALWMLGAVFGFSALAVAGRQLSAGLDTFEIMTYRSAVGVIAVLITAKSMRQLHTITARALPLHLGRNLGHFAGQNLWLFALTLIPLAQLFALEFSYPILVAIAASLFMGERLSRVQIAAFAVGFIGILIVAQPFGAGGVSIGLMAALACAFGFAASALFTKRLTQTAKTSVICVLFWLSVMQLIMGLICAGIDGHIQLPNLEHMPWIIVISLSGLGAHFCLTTALSIAPAAIVTPIDFLRLPVISVIGMVFYAEALNIYVFLGAALIFSSNYVNIIAESRK